MGRFPPSFRVRLFVQEAEGPVRVTLKVLRFPVWIPAAMLAQEVSVRALSPTRTHPANIVGTKPGRQSAFMSCTTYIPHAITVSAHQRRC